MAQSIETRALFLKELGVLNVLIKHELSRSLSSPLDKYVQLENFLICGMVHFCMVSRSW